MANYSWLTRKEMPEVPENKVFQDINFVQAKPHTKIYEGVKGLTFRKCNLNNCDIPEDAKEENCGHVHISYCANLHPDWGLDACAVECEHMTDKSEVVVDGVDVFTEYHYEDKGVI